MRYKVRTVWAKSPVHEPEKKIQKSSQALKKRRRSYAFSRTATRSVSSDRSRQHAYLIRLSDNFKSNEMQSVRMQNRDTNCCGTRSTNASRFLLIFRTVQWSLYARPIGNSSAFLRKITQFLRGVGHCTVCFFMSNYTVA